MNRITRTVLGIACGWVCACGEDARPAPSCEVETAVVAASLSSSPSPVCARKASRKAVDPTQLVLPDGTLLVAPFEGFGVGRSVDQGRTFSVALSMAAEPQANWLHPWLWRDGDSGRVFYHVYRSNGGTCGNGTGTNLWLSDDGGKTWAEVAGGVGCDSWDWGKLISGAARRPESKEALRVNGYPNIVYFCAGGTALIVGPKRFCYRSLDGGRTFARTRGNPVDTSVLAQNGYPGAGAVAPDGTFYMARQSLTGVQLVVSEDEGDSWHVIDVPNSKFSSFLSLNFLTSNVATDSIGNLYVSWVDDADLRPYVATSKDRGLSWSLPFMLAPDEVKVAACLSLAVVEPGVVATSYLGSSQIEAPPSSGYFVSDQRPYASYFTAASGLLSSSPSWWTTRITPPGEIAFTGMSFQVSEYLGPAAITADGVAWASFLDEGGSVLGHAALRLAP